MCQAWLGDLLTTARRRVNESRNGRAEISDQNSKNPDMWNGTSGRPASTPRTAGELGSGRRALSRRIGRKLDDESGQRGARHFSE